MNYKGFMGNKLLSGLLLIIVCLPLISWSQVQKRNYAVIGLKNAEGVSAGEAEIIADRLRIELFNTGGASMMERDQMQEILSEQGFQQTGACTDEACMIEIGQLLGVERLISGSIGKLGSMFLLNFRAIDVQTAKIIAVVSKDISGGIEDVVKLLPSVARELVEAAAPKKPVDAPATEVIEPEKKEPEVVEAKPEVKEPEEKEPVPEVAEVESGKRSKNKNRSGVRISFNLFPGEIPMEVYDDSTNKYEDVVDEEFFNSLKDEDEYSSVFYNKSHFRLQVNFMIKAGEFLTIDIGPGLMFCKKNGGYIFEDFYDIYYADYIDKEYKWRIIAPNFSAGINFVKRFYPLKINVGFLLDFNLNIFRYTWSHYEYGYDASDQYYSYDFDVDDIDFAINVSFGPRVGLEILAGKHFGFNVDFLYRYDKIEKEFTLEEKNSGLENDVKWKYKMPGIGFGAGINFYY